MRHQVLVIIGGYGFIGKGLTAHCAALFEKIVIIGRHHFQLGQDGKKEDICSLPEFERVLQDYIGGLDVVMVDFSYTTVPNTSFADPVKDFSENLYNVIRYLELAKAIKVYKYIYISSGGTVYGNTGESLTGESHPTFPLSPYGISKLACERYVYLYNQVHMLPAIVLRPSNIYGPGQKPFRGQGFIANAMGLIYKGEPIQIFGDGSYVRDYLYIDDFCKALMDIIDYGDIGEIYNISYGIGHNLNEVIDCLNDEIVEGKNKVQTLHLSARPFDVRYNVLDNKKVTLINGWKPTTTLKAGIAQTWIWMQEYMMKTC